MPKSDPHKLFRDDLKANALVLEDHFQLHRERDVPVTAFEIDTADGSTGRVRVEDGKYKSALILLYLTQQSDNKQFFMNDDLRKIARDYFGTTIVRDAFENPETRHTTVRELLDPGQVIVTVYTREKAPIN